MPFALREAGTWTEVAGPFVVADVQYPANWPDLASAEERGSLGLFEIQEAGEEPAGCQVLGMALVGRDTPRWEWVCVPLPLGELRAQRWEAAKAVREAISNGTCPTPLGVVNCDPAARLNIAGAVQMAQIAQQQGVPFTIDWTMADDSSVTHDGPQMIAMGVAAGGFYAACHTRSQQIRAALDAAMSPAELAAVEIDTGYPAQT